VFPDGLVADLERPTAVGIHCVVAASTDSSERATTNAC